MKFYEWFLEKHLGKDTIYGDLANDIKRDKNFPKDAERDEILDYLEWHVACKGAIAAFKQVWGIYQRQQSRKIKESRLEQKLKTAVEAAGGMCLKFVSPGMVGVPDRICLFHGGRVVFVEVKAEGKKPRPLQLKRHEELQTLGFEVKVIDREEQIDGICAT